MCYECKICSKDYSSYQSLWNHNKKFHNTNVVPSGNIIEFSVIDTEKINVIEKINNIGVEPINES
jgi:hypothetical protein